MGRGDRVSGEKGRYSFRCAIACGNALREHQWERIKERAISGGEAGAIAHRASTVGPKLTKCL